MNPKFKNKTQLTKYLLNAFEIAYKAKQNDIVELQFLTRNKEVILCGIEQSIQFIKDNILDLDQIKIWAAKEGTKLKPYEVCLSLKAPAWNIIYLENCIDGILAAQSTIATNAFKIVQAANDKHVIYMNDRNDFMIKNSYDGYAAYIGGIRFFTSQSQVALLKDKSDFKIIGSIPHSLIALYHGNLAALLKDYQKYLPNQDLIGLVDYNADIVNDTLSLLEANLNLKGVRVDLGQSLIDKSLRKYQKNKAYPDKDLYGVTPLLIKTLKKSLIKHHAKHIKIIASSGFDIDKINWFEEQKTPVDYYGVGLAFKKNYVDFTGNFVSVNGKILAKKGIKYQSIKNLKKIKLKDY